LAEAIAEEDAKEAAAKTARSRRQAAERACSATSTAASSDEWSVVGSVSPKLSALEPVVRLAAAEVSARVGSSTVQAPPSHVLGLLPPTPSSSGRRYYALRHHHPGGPGVACGQPIALCWLGGVWIGFGAAPAGFWDLESAINSLALLYPTRTFFPVYVRPALESELQDAGVLREQADGRRGASSSTAASLVRLCRR